jgi:hypothetical protein
MACYENIIGITHADCPCGNIAGRPTDYAVSNSGLYLSDLVGMQYLNSISDCFTGGEWDIATDSIREAITIFKADTNQLLMGLYRVKRSAYVGNIGETLAVENVQNGKLYRGLWLRVPRVKGGTLKIKNIGTLFSFTGSKTVELYRESVLVDTFALQTQQNQHKPNDVSFEIDMSNDYEQVVNYYLVYQHDPNAPARRNRLMCACGNNETMYGFEKEGKSCFNKNHSDAKNHWANWVAVNGFQANDLSSPNPTKGLLMNGLTIGVEIGCKISSVICNNQFDFETNPVSLAVALAVRYRAAIILASKVRSSTQLTRETFVNEDEFAYSIEKWEAGYKEKIDFIAANVDLTGNDCVVCKDFMEMKTNVIFS